MSIKGHAPDYRVFAQRYVNDISILNLSTDDVLAVTNNQTEHQHIEKVLFSYFQLTPNIDPAWFSCLNWRIMQSDYYAAIGQLGHIVKMSKQHFKGRTLPWYDVLLRTNSQVEDSCTSEMLRNLTELKNLEKQHVSPFRSLCSKIQCATTQTCPDLALIVRRNGFSKVMNTPWLFKNRSNL